MVTDAVAVPARPEATIPYRVRLLLTIALLALYALGRQVPLPLVDGGALAEVARFSGPMERLSIVALGINPLITGFLVVELFALVTSPGRRLLKGGAAGRAKLNRAALITGLVVATVQAVGISSFLGSATSPGGAPLLVEPGWGSRLLIVATLTAVTAAVFVLGNLLSDYGIGNGFALLMLAEIGLSFLQSGVVVGREGFGGSTPAWLGLLVVAVLTGLLVRWFRSADAAQVAAFPQGLFPVQLAMTALALPLFMGISGSVESWDPAKVSPVLTLILVPVFSWLAFHLFSSRPRLEANVPEPDEVLDRLAAILKRRLLLSTALLTVGAAILLAWTSYHPETFVAWVEIVDLVLIVAIVLDLWDQRSFLSEPQTTARLVQLDNVHFACRLVARLREEEIEPLARGLRFRSLFFFFGALFKIDVLVPFRDLNRARQILAELEVAREIKVF